MHIECELLTYFSRGLTKSESKHLAANSSDLVLNFPELINYRPWAKGLCKLYSTLNCLCVNLRDLLTVRLYLIL